MGHERHIEAMRDARHSLPSDGLRRADRHRKGRRASRGRRLLRLVVVLALVAVVAIAVVVVIADLTGGGEGGGFAGTWRKSGPGTELVIKDLGDGTFTIVVSLGSATAAGGDGTSPSPAASARSGRTSKATLDGDVLTAEAMLGVPGLTVTFALEDDGAVLVETFPNGSQDRLERVD
jgi:hypothetical protein